VRDLVSYEAEQLGQLRIAFENAVDNYLETCEREGLMPDKPFDGSFNVRLSPNFTGQLQWKPRASAPRSTI
jgi:predicted HicB family RNase H-like nuclease